MADRIIKPDNGNNVIIQNDDASGKIAINEDASVVLTGTFNVSGGTFTTSTAQKQAIVDGAEIEAQDLASGSGTSLPNNVQDAITRLGIVTSGTFNGIIGGSAIFPAGMSYYVSSFTDNINDSSDVVLNTTHGFGQVVGPIAVPNGVRIRMHITGGMIEYDAGSNYGTCINYHTSTFSTSTTGTFESLNFTNNQSSKLTSVYCLMDYSNTSGSSVNIYFRCGLKSDTSTTARWYTHASSNGTIRKWYELIKI